MHGTTPPPFVAAIASGVRDAGGRALVVGGWVRDTLLRESRAPNLESRSTNPESRIPNPGKDIDMEVFGIAAEKLPGLLASFGRVEAVGQSFPVYKVVGPDGVAIDVALPRRESKQGRGHKGFEVRGDPFMSLEEAAHRRDFTINAISWDPLTDEYVDPVNGRADLEQRLLRAVNRTTFGDDSLRALRAVQFAARFEFTLEAATADLCRRIRLDDLPPERIWGELEKLLLQAARPSIGFTLARDLGIVEQVLAEMIPLIGCEQEPEWHPEGDVWIHTLMVIDRARELNDDLDRPRLLTVMLGAICHDLGKPSTTAFIDGRIRSLDHEQAGVAPSISLLDRLNVHTIDGFDVRLQVIGLVAHHLKPGMLHKAANVGDGAFRRLAQKVDLELLTRLARADCLGRTGTFDCSAMDWFLARARALGVEHRPPAPLLLGRHLLELGLRPGPRVGEVLKQVYEKQLDGEITSVEEGLEEAERILARLG
ncbi:MAG TPA: HD domain-containing protein [Vicinamibacterales bacterium]|nr:HD domain-containing protein [Vicinamibacterales bacterium]